MSGRGRDDRGKMPVTKSRGRLKRLGDLAAQTKRRRSQRQTSRPLVQPIPPLSQPTPPAVQPTPPAVQSTPDACMMGPFELGLSSYHNTHEPVPQYPPQVEEEGHEEHDPLHKGPRQYLKDADGKIIIRPIGRGWTPSSAAANAIRTAIEAQFEGPHHCWSETPDGVKKYWWDRFRDKVSWDPRHHDLIYNTFKQRCAKRLSDMLSKVRKKGAKPSWMGDEAWDGLLTYWASQDFQKISTQNKTNRASGIGGAVHTTGRKAHHEVALDMAIRLGRSVDPAEIFLVTHKKRSGNWVDSRSQRTYVQIICLFYYFLFNVKDSYHRRLSQIQTQADEASTSGTQEVDGVRKLDLWREVAGGKTRGRCYGTADLSSNLRGGISSLTQESLAPSCEEVIALREATARAEEKATKAEERAARAEACYDDLEGQFRAMMERMTALEHRSVNASCSVSQPRRHRRR